MFGRILLAILLLTPLGCALSTEPGAAPEAALGLQPGEVVFRAERSSYAVGDTARIVLRNESGGDIGYNLCFSSRELRAGSEWRRYEYLRVCTAALYLLKPGEETVLEEPITGEWQPGEYRVVTTIERMGSGERGEVSTPSFSVVAR